MSNNAAIRRRAGTSATNPIGQYQRVGQNQVLSNDHRASPNMQAAQQPVSTSGGKGLTLQQVITLMDNRLISLEKSSKSTAEIIEKLDTAQRVYENEDNSLEVSTVMDEKLNEFISEFNSRTELLATEINSLKQIVLNLQAYTLEINKTLMEERIRILSDIPQKTSVINNTINPITTEEVELEDLASPDLEISKQNDITYEYNEAELLAEDITEDTATSIENEDLQDQQLLNKKRQKGGANNKKSLKLAV